MCRSCGTAQSGSGKNFFSEIIAHPVPLDLHTLKSLKRSSLGLDLYLWLNYRTFTLKTPLTLTWRQLFRQFGADPLKVSQHGSVSMFRAAVAPQDSWTVV